jgi:hypothetical protein
MKGLIESLSFGSGAFLIAIFSAGIVAVIVLRMPQVLAQSLGCDRAVGSVLLPLLVSGLAC